MASNLSNLRFLKIPLATVVLFSLICTQIPLFNYLGFEFSALTALVLGFIAGIATISLWKKHTAAQTDIPLDEEGFWRYLKSVAGALILLSVLPAVVMSTNAMLIKNCSFSQGLMFYGLLVFPGVAFCSSLALLISVTSLKWKKTWFTSVYVILLSHIVFITFTRPQIYAFNPVIGFFPGITYDETMHIEGRLLLYRWATISASLLMFIMAVVLHRSRTWAKDIRDGQSGSPRRVWHVTELAGAMLLTAIVVGVFIFSSRLGLSSPRSFVEEELGGKIETQHFVLYYPTSVVDETRARQLAKLHEFYFTGIVSELNIVSVKKIQSFIYASAEQKARLIGAGRTNIAKPWLWQMHLNLGDVESSLKHEMVHVLAADFGFPLIRVGLNPGLIEGLAAAVERVQYEQPLHRVAAQILSVGINPRMEQLFSFTGFAGTYSGVSYTLAGSFSKYLIDQYGVRRFKRLYRTGDFHAIYNKDISILLAEWRRFLEKYEIDAREQLRAAYYFKRTSIFGKECARVIANIDAETRQHFGRKEYGLAYESATRSLELSRSPGAVSSSVNALVRLGKFSDAVELAEEYLSDSSLAHTLLPLKLQLGDAYWATGATNKARLLYEELLSTHISLSLDEGAALRLEALKDAGLAAALLPYFTGALSDTTRISTLRASLRVPVRKDIATYLLAREYASQGDQHRAIELFGSIGKLPRELLEFQRQLRLARLYYSIGEFQRAKIHFWQSYNYTTSESFLFRIREWIELCNWMIDPPREMFKDEGGELQAFWDAESPCGCEPKRVAFLPSVVD